jgi:ABC-type amino acid transport substrate-binding protein
MRLVLLLLAFLVSACGGGRHAVVRIGVDPTWSPLAFDELQPYVNGYTEDLLLEVARYTGMHFEKIPVNWDTLLTGMQEGKYDAVLCSLPPYNFNLAKYDFTENFLNLGPVLVTPANAHYTHLKQLAGEPVGVISGDPAVLVLETYPEVIIRNYNDIPDLLNAVASGEIEAAVLDKLRASNYVRDLYASKLKIASEPMNDVGLHAITRKGASEKFVRQFNHAIESMKKRKTLDDLQKKWSL